MGDTSQGHCWPHSLPVFWQSWPGIPFREEAQKGGSGESVVSSTDLERQHEEWAQMPGKIQHWASEQEARQTQSQRRKTNFGHIFLESGQALQLSSLWSRISRKPGPTDCVLAGDLCGAPECSVLLRPSLHILLRSPGPRGTSLLSSWCGH